MPLFLRRLLHVFRPGASGTTSGDPLHAFRGEWIAGRRRAAPLLGEAWEQKVMRAVRLAAVEEPAVPDWLAQRLQPGPDQRGHRPPRPRALLAGRGPRRGPR